MRGGENGGESLEIANWQLSPISTFGWHLTLSWVGDASLASWSSGGRSTVSPVEALIHSGTPSPLHLAEAVFLLPAFWLSLGGFMFFYSFHTSGWPQLLVGGA